MFNFKKIGKKVLSSVLGATLAMGGFLNTQIVKANGQNENKYWDAFAMLSNAKFILGDNKQDEIENLKKKLEATGEVEGEIDNLLRGNTNAKNIYNAVKQFITCENADLDKLRSTGFSFDKRVCFGNIGTITDISGNKIHTQTLTYNANELEKTKIIVFIVVPDNRVFTRKHMDYIKDLYLSSHIYSNNCYNNVNFIIRPQESCADFEIERDAISERNGATINLQGANITEKYTISNCDGATINLQGANINAEYAISRCEKATINLQGANITERYTISNCNGAAINLQGAKILYKYAIFMCNNVKINYDKSTNVPSDIEGLTYECADVNFINQNENSDNNNNNTSNNNYTEQRKKSFLQPLIVGGGILAVLAACLISIPVIGPIIEQHIKNRKTKVNIKKTNTNINTHTNK